MLSKKRRLVNRMLKKFKNRNVSYIHKNKKEEMPTESEEGESDTPQESSSEDTDKQIKKIMEQVSGKPQINITQKENSERVTLPEKIYENIELRKDVLSRVRDVDESYPITSTNVGGRSVPLSFARVFYDSNQNQLRYSIVEPKLNPKLNKIIKKTIQELHDRLEIDFNKIRESKDVYRYINKEIDEIWDMLGFKPDAYESIKVKYYIFREAVGMGKIDVLAQDPNIEDISCDGIGLPIYVYHRNPLYGEISTNISFDGKDELDSFAMRLAQKCNRTISVANPLVDGSLKDGSRVQITLGTDIARRGSNFTIRKFFRKPLTPVDLMTFGTASPLILAYLWLAIEYEKSVLVSGTTAVGKTTMLNVLSLFIEPNMKIVSIEDTPELQLPHNNWMPQATRSGFGATDYGRVEMYDLLKASLRQRPDYLIVGEVRGKEANVLFHAMSTGHPGLSTIHADNTNAVIDRLTTRPISLPVSLLENLDILVFLDKTKRRDTLIRRISEVIEVEGFDTEKNELKTNKVFKWVPSKDEFKSRDSYLLKQIAERAGMDSDEIQKELMRRAKILGWMRKNNIYNFDQVAKLIHMYYINPKELAEHIK